MGRGYKIPRQSSVYGSGEDGGDRTNVSIYLPCGNIV